MLHSMAHLLLKCCKVCGRAIAQLLHTASETIAVVLQRSRGLPLTYIQDPHAIFLQSRVNRRSMHARNQDTVGCGMLATSHDRVQLG
jgi:hypothetical protein